MPKVTDASLATVADSLTSAAGAIAEQLRQKGAGGTPPFEPVNELLANEVLRLRGEGQTALADALQAIGKDMNNG
jgi:hypothetical protein